MPIVPVKPVHVQTKTPCKRCRGCGTEKKVTNFSPSKLGAFGVSSLCRACSRKRLNEYQKTDQQQIRIAERASLIEQLKDKPCADCGGTFPTVCMDFDHRDPAMKSFNIGMNRYTKLEKLLTEVEKCDVICANCHRIRTIKGKRNGSIRLSPGRPRFEEV